MIKAEWTNADALDLQPTCNQLATDSISRQAAIDALEKVAELFPWRVPGKRDTYDSYNEAWNDAIGRAEMEIENLPSAQPEQRKGKWEYSDDLEETLVCSACRYDTMDYEPSNFCPNCGADMRGEG